MGSQPRSLRSLLLVVAAFTLLCLLPSHSWGTHVSCGDTISQDTRLDSDLINCPVNGIVIGANNITLDLNGHRIQGDGVGFCDAGVEDGGVGCAQAPVHYDGITVRDGTISGFRDGVIFFDAKRNTARNLILSSNSTHGVNISYGGGGNVVARNAVSDSSSGIAVYDAGDGNRVTANTLSARGFGIFLSGFGNGTVIEKNVVSDSVLGIFLSDSFGTTVIGKNSIRHNSFGIALLESQRALIEKNRVFDSTRGDGISVDDRLNTIIRNVSSGNADDGIEVRSPSANTPDPTSVGGNRTDRNGDLGIEADEFVVDLGGNRASGNGNPLQCLNIRCK